MRGNSHARCEAGEKTEMISNSYLSLSWRPADLSQREGRIIRQGNENETVHIYTYVTKDTFDAYLYQLIENKQRFISQIMQGGDTVRDAEDVDEAVLSYAEIKALATGNPLIREKMELETDLSRLKVLNANYVNQHYQLGIKVRQTYPEQIEKQTQAIQGYLEDIALLQKQTPAAVLSDTDTSPTETGFTQLIIAGQPYTERKEAGEALLTQLKQVAFSHAAVPIGSYKGFTLSAYYSTLANNFYAELAGSMTYTIELGKDAGGNISRLDNKLKALPETLQKAQEKLERTKADFARAKEELAKPFAQEETLQKLQIRLEEINKELAIGTPTPDFSSTDEAVLAESGLTKTKNALAMERM